MATTSPDNLLYPVGTDPVAPLHTTLAAMQGSVQDALTALDKRFPRSAASSAQRDAAFPNPVQGNRVYRTDRKYTEAYFAAYNATTNPGGTNVAGWYPIDGLLFGKITRTTTLGFAAGTVTVNFNSVSGTVPGFWTNGDNAKLYLPQAGLWEVKGWATTGGADGGVVRSTITLNGADVAVGDIRDDVFGGAGINDPFVNPHGIVSVTNATSYVSLVLSTNKTGAVAPPGVSLWAKYLGPVAY